MRTPRLRSTPPGFGPRAATSESFSAARNSAVRASESVTANSALVPTPVWKMTSLAGRFCSEMTICAMACGSRSGSSASAGAWNGTPPRPATRPASCSPMRVSRIATCFGCIALTRDARVRQDQPVDGIAHQGARQVELRAEAHRLQRLGIELGHDHVGHRLDGGVARLLAAADVGHLAEALALVHHVEQLAAEGHLGLAF